MKSIDTTEFTKHRKFPLGSRHTDKDGTPYIYVKIEGRKEEVKMEKKICPLKSKVVSSGRGGYISLPAEKLYCKDSCAWWNSTLQECSVVTLMHALTLIVVKHNGGNNE